MTSSIESIPLEISVVSADVLKKPKFFNRPRAYVVVTLAGGSIVSRQRTPVDEHNGGKPHWNFKMRFEVERSKLELNSAVLVLQLRRSRTIGDKDIGSVYIPVKELFDGAAGTKSSRPVAYPVSSRSGKPKGVVYLSYVFGDFRVGTILSRESPSATTSALRQRGVSGQKIPRPVRETTVVGGGGRVVVPSAPPCPVPSAPPCPVPSAPYFPIGGYFPVNGACPSAPYIRQDFGSLI